MATVEVKCPTCNGVQVYKYGKSRNGIQRYLCHAQVCPRKTFRLEYCYEGAKPGTNEKIIAMAANASGIRDTANRRESDIVLKHVQRKCKIPVYRSNKLLWMPGIMLATCIAGSNC